MNVLECALWIAAILNQGELWTSDRFNSQFAMVLIITVLRMCSLEAFNKDWM